MLNEIEIRKLAMKTGVPSGVIEKDYILTKFLFFMKDTDNLVFKGGTAIKKAYIDWMRFSEDLDFTLIKDNNITKILEKICDGIDIEMEIKDVAKFRLSETFTVSFVGPLKHKSSFKIDISRRERPILEPVKKKIIHFYPDIPKFSFNVMALEEVVAEKLRAAYTRGASRDILDINYLSMLGFKKAVVKNLFIKKLEILQIKKIEENRFVDVVRGFDESDIRYLIPFDNIIKKDDLIKSVLEKYKFLFK